MYKKARRRYNLSRYNASKKVEKIMAYVVTENCIRCKYTDCVDVCPVDCFYEGENMLAINPDECIDCGVCEPECPAEAIKAGDESNLDWQEINRDLSQKWPNISKRKDPLPGADDAKHEKNKKQYLSENPGSGS